jgi:hypothetical protein
MNTREGENRNKNTLTLKNAAVFLLVCIELRAFVVFNAFQMFREQTTIQRGHVE